MNQSDPSYVPISIVENKFLSRRKCTNFPCFIIFLIFVFLVILFSVVSYFQGNIKNLNQPYDIQTQPCGRDKLENYNYIYFNDSFNNLYKENSICIKKCPKNENTTIDCYKNKKYKNCEELKIYESVVYIGRVCLPKHYYNINLKNLNIKWQKQLLEDTQNAWLLYIILYFIAIVISVLIFFIILAPCSKLITNILIIISIVSLTLLGVLFYLRYNHYKDKLYANIFDQDYLALAITIWCISSILMFYMICFIFQQKNIKKVFTVLKVILYKNLRVFLVSLFLSIFFMLILAWWIFTIVMLYTTGNLESKKDQVLASFDKQTWSSISIWFIVIAFFWFSSFIKASHIMIVSYIICIWYFERDNKKKLTNLKMIQQCWENHIGSIAFGSFYQIFLWPFQITLGQIFKIIRFDNGNNFIQRLFLHYNSNAYIEVILRKIDFQNAAKSSQKIYKNFYKQIGQKTYSIDILCISMYFLIASLITFLGFIAIRVQQNVRNELIDSIGCYVVFFIIGYFASSFFIGNILIFLNTILHCHVLDRERFQQNQGVTGTFDELEVLLSAKMNIEFERINNQLKNLLFKQYYL